MTGKDLAEHLALAEFPTSRPLRGAFRLGCHSAWKGKTPNHCPYGQGSHGERGYRSAWLAGWEAGVQENAVRIG